MQTNSETNFFGSKYSYFLAVILASVTLLWGTNVIDGVDVNWHDNGFHEFIKRISGIDPSINGGTDRSNNYATLLWITLEALFTSPFYHSGILSKIPELITQRFFYGFIIFLISSIFFRTCEKLSEKPLNKYAACIAGLCFAYSYYFYFAWPRLQLNILSIPLFMVTLTLAQAVREGVFKKEWLYYFLPCTFISADIGLQPPLMAMWIFEVLILAMVAAGSLRDKIRFCILAFGGFFLVNIFWIVPFVAFILNNHLASASQSKEIFSVMHTFDWMSGYTTYSNVLAGAAEFTFFDVWEKPYNPAAFHALSEYGHKKIMLIIISIFSICYGIKHYKPSANNVFRSLCLLYLVSVFFGLGGYGPQGHIMRYLVSEVPLFWAFRATWQKAGMLQLVSCSLLLYFALSAMFERLALLDKKESRSEKSLKNLSSVWIFLLSIPLCVGLSLFYAEVKWSSGYPVSDGLVGQFALLSFTVSTVYCLLVVISSPKNLGRVLSYLIPLSTIIYLTIVMIINAHITGDNQLIPRLAPLVGHVPLIIFSLLYHDLQLKNNNLKNADYFLLERTKRTDFYMFVFLMLVVLHIHADFIKGEAFPSHKVPGSYAYEVHAGYRPEIPEWIYYLGQQIDQPGCISILLPISSANLYPWGWGSSDVLVSRAILKHSTLIFKEYGEGYTVNEAQTLKFRNQALLDDLMSNKMLNIRKLKDMGVCYFILRTDFNDRKPFTEIPTAFYQKKIDATPLLKRVPIIGAENETYPGIWKLYKVGEPHTTRNGYGRDNFIFPSHFSYYLNSPDPEVDNKFVAIHLPSWLQSFGRFSVDTILIAKPFYFFLWGIAAFIAFMGSLPWLSRHIHDSKIKKAAA